MKFVRVTAADVDAIAAFMCGHVDYLMFPLSNLARYGMDGNDDLAPRIWRNEGREITDVFSVTRSGNLTPYLPSGDFASAASMLSGHPVRGLIGEAASVRGLVTPLGLAQVAPQLRTEEGHFVVQLADASIPNGTSHLVPLSDQNRNVVTEWMVDYHIHALDMPVDAARASVPTRIARELDEGRRVVLMEGDTPVATTSFNAALPDAVQIGGVYTPPAHRGKGHARRALGLHLQQARAAGVKTAVLSADLPSAIAAYQSVGFRRIGDWSMITFATPQVIA